MLGSVGNGTKEGKMAKHVQQGDASEFQRTVNKWRRLNGLEPLYGVEKERQVLSIG